MISTSQSSNEVKLAHIEELRRIDPFCSWWKKEAIMDAHGRIAWFAWTQPTTRNQRLAYEALKVTELQDALDGDLEDLLAEEGGCRR